MATQRCPKCKSNRVRQGYRPTSALLKLVFRYHLLCDECNWEFTGFAIPGTVTKKTKKKKTNNVLLAKESNFNNTKVQTDLISEILLERPTIENAPESEEKIEDKPKRKRTKKVIEKKPPLFDNDKIESKKQSEENTEVNDQGLKKQRTKKKVRVKFY